MRLSFLTMFVLAFCIANSQTAGTKTSIIINATSLNWVKGTTIVKIKKFQPDSAEVYGLIKELTLKKPITITTIDEGEPFFAIAEVHRNDSMIVFCPTFLVTGSTLTVKFKEREMEALVKGGENSFFYENNLLFFELPYTIVSEKGYSAELVKHMESVSVPSNPILQIKYKEYERNAIKTVRDNRDLFFTLTKLYNKRSYFSTKTLQEAFDLLSSRYKNTSIGNKLQAYISSSRQLYLGKKIPSFKVRDVENKSISVDKEFFVSKYTLIDFWASWCIPCRTKMKEIKSIFDATDKAKLQIVSISIDENKDNWTKAMHQDDITWKSYIDTKGWNGDIAKTFALTSIPRNILVDRSGTIVAIDIGDTQLQNFLKNKD